MHESCIFLHAQGLSTAAERVAYLDEACAGDPRLRADVEALLRAHESDPLFLERPALSTGGGAARPPSTGVSGPRGVGAGESAGTVFAGRYHLRELIGEGGMGAVWRADQTEPVRRPVAVKLIKPGMDSRAVLARFAVERQALARMDHPNIARVLDAGATPDGRPFFVMELVDGVPFTRYCDARALSPRQRLRLFVDVCRAVQHAHQKGVIHRDLKPSNVLVAEVDGRPVPKVIDFGVAKAAGEPLTELSLATGIGMVIGTPEYTSPEQAGFGRQDVDTRADVYALGVLLYELLTGSAPIDRATVDRVGVLEVLRLVREVDPPRPSRRLATDTPLPGAVRGADPRRLAAVVRGDLDWIVMKCLEKDRDRRYETANGLAADVERYLAGEPVAAAPPGAAYRVRKFIHRNRAAVTAAGLVAASLLLGIAGTTAGLLRANEAWRAEAKRADGEQAANEQIRQGNEILREIFAQLDPHADLGDDRSVRAALTEQLTAAAARLDGGAVRDPEVLAGLYHTLGDSLLGLGQPERAADLFGKARDLRTARAGPDHPDTLTSLHGAARCQANAGRYDRAVPLHEESLRRRTAALGPDHPDTLQSMADLALVYQGMHLFDRSIPLLEDALRRRTSALGPDHPDAVNNKHLLATMYVVVGRTAEACPLFDEAYRWRTVHFGPDHPGTLTSLDGLGRSHQAAGRHDRALPLIDEAYRRRAAKFGADHPDTLVGLNNLAAGYMEAGRFAEAIPLFEDAVRRYTVRAGPDHRLTMIALGGLVCTYLKAGQVEKALPLCERLAAGIRRVQESNPAMLATMLANVSAHLLDTRQFAVAEPYVRECLAIREKVQPDAWTLFSARALLGRSLLGQGKLAEAEPLLLDAYDGLKQRQTSMPPVARDRLPEAADRLVELYDRLGRPDESAKWQAERAKYPPAAPPPRPADK